MENRLFNEISMEEMREVEGGEITLADVVTILVKATTILPITGPVWMYK